MKKTGIPSKTIVRVLKSGNIKYFRRSDKKVFQIQNEETTPFIQIDGEDFFNADEIQERFGISRTIFFNQLCKKRTHFLDSREKSHEVTWKSNDLEKFINLLKEAKMAGSVTMKVIGRGNKKQINKILQERKEKALISVAEREF